MKKKKKQKFYVTTWYFTTEAILQWRLIKLKKKEEQLELCPLAAQFFAPLWVNTTGPVSLFCGLPAFRQSASPENAPCWPVVVLLMCGKLTGPNHTIGDFTATLTQLP